MITQHRHIAVDGITIFYREAGHPASPTLLLLHGFPTSSHQFRRLIPALSDRFHLVAPDMPCFGFSDMPSRETYAYSFDRIATTIERFTEALGLGRYAVYMFDYGAPIGMRLALRHPERITAIISQNGNAYVEGVSEALAPIQAYWSDPSAQNRNALRGLLTADTTKFQYVHGASNPALVDPATYTLDQALLDRPGNDEIQLDLFLDYQSNVALYAEFQAYLRAHQPRLLAVWGRHDPFFLPAGAEAFRRDVPGAEVHLVDSGHFPLESAFDETVAPIMRFLD